MRLRIDVAREEIGDFCPLKLVALVVYGILSTSASPPSPAPPSNFWSVIEGWGKTWMWENLTIWGDASWLAEAIADNSLVAVTDGSYMKDVYPHINSAAFIFQCSKGCGCLWDSFVEHTPDAGSYRGKLLGLMAIHLILHGVNVVSSGLRGSVLILSDCLGALDQVKDLPRRTGFQLNVVTWISSRILCQTAAVYLSLCIIPMSRLTSTMVRLMVISRAMRSLIVKWITLPRLQFMKHSLLKKFPWDNSPSSQ